MNELTKKLYSFMKIFLKASYFHDQESGWLHMRINVLEDRTQGGTLHQKIDVGGEIIEESFDIAPHPNFEGNGLKVWFIIHGH